MEGTAPSREEPAAGLGRERVRAIDAYRAVAVAMVVVGHWSAFALTTTQGRLDGENVLRLWEPGAWLTWLFQVMPVFFMVGGYAGAASWLGRDPRTTSVAWCGARLWRLLLPTTVLLGSAVTAAAAMTFGGVEARLADLVLTLVGLPLWFLSAYVLVVAATPLLATPVARWGLRAPLALIAACLVVDVMANHLGVPLVGWVNIALFWTAVYVIGIAWRTGALEPVRAHAWLLVAASLTALLTLVTFGPYPVSMLAAPGAEVQNNGPPSAALVALALTQLGVVLQLERSVERWCERRGVWRVVIGVNAVALSIYLWHMPAAVVAALAFWRVGLVDAIEPVGVVWWATRPLWLAACGAVLVVMISMVRRVEQRRPVLAPRPATGLSRTAAVTGSILAAAGMLPLAVAGLTTRPAALAAAGLAVLLIGLLALRRSAGIIGSRLLTLRVGE